MMIVENIPAEPHGQLTSDPGYLYHATNVDGLTDIAQSGYIDVFEPWHGTDQDMWPDGATEPRAYFSPKAEIVWQFAPEYGQPAIIRVPDSVARFRKESTGDIYSREPVPVEHGEYLASDGKWYPLRAMAESIEQTASAHQADWDTWSISFGEGRAVLEVTEDGRFILIHDMYAAPRGKRLGERALRQIRQEYPNHKVYASKPLPDAWKFWAAMKRRGLIDGLSM